MDQDLFENTRWLIGAIARGLHAGGTPGAIAVLDRLAEQNLGPAAFRLPGPRRLPVLAHFEACVAESMLVDADLAAALAALAEELHWTQSPAYSDAVLGEGFIDNYGWCHIIGPQGFFKGDDFLLGFLMLGPSRHYRDHYHPAPELYWPLTSRSQWKRGQGHFVEKRAGGVIWHEPNEIHATRTVDRPLLALWAWTSETSTSAKLVEP
jgi:Dimethlysulfonioproprionate lyase